MPSAPPLTRVLDAGAFIRRLQADSAPTDAAAVSASMDWTVRCNLRCRHCYIRTTDPRAADALTTVQVVRVLDTLAAGGVLFLVITGGDPLLRPDFCDLYVQVRRRGFIPTLYTNGTLLDERRLDCLAAFPPRRVEITLYGHTPAVYEKVTGVPGAYDACRRGIEALLRRGILVRLKAMLMRSNAHEFEAMRDEARALGCDFRYDTLIHPRLDGGAFPLEERLPPHAAVRLQYADAAQRCEFLDYLKTADPLPPQDRLFECGAGLRTLHVDARGQAHPCLLWQTDPYDLLQRPLDAGWWRHVAQIRQRVAPEGACRSCAERGLCQYCAPLAALENGRAGQAEPYYCALARARRDLAPEAPDGVPDARKKD